MKFKIGDKCRPKKGRNHECHSFNSNRGDYIVITGIKSDGNYNYYIYNNNIRVSYCNNCLNDTNLELINQNTMNIKEKFVLAFTKEPQKSFRKVGITNGDDILTEDGQKIFLSYLLHSKYAEDFKKEVVDDMLKDLEKESK